MHSTPTAVLFWEETKEREREEEEKHWDMKKGRRQHAFICFDEMHEPTSIIYNIYYGNIICVNIIMR